MDIVHGMGLDKMIGYYKKKLQMLLAFQVTPVLIFDGARLQMKGGTED